MTVALQLSTIRSQKTPILRGLSPFRVAIAATLLTLIPGYFWGEHREQARRYAAWVQETRVREALLRDVRVVLPNPQHSTLRQAVAQLRCQVGVPIYLNPQIAGAALDPQYLIARGAGAEGIYQGTLDNVLGQLLRSADAQSSLVYRVVDGRIAIEMAISNTDDHQLMVETYPIPPAGSNRIAFSEKEVARLIITTIDPSMWDDVGGTCSANPSPGGVNIAASSEGQRNVRLLLQQLADLPARPLSLNSVAYLDLGHSGPYLQTEAEAGVLKSLEQKGNFQYSGVPLREFLRDISARLEVPMMIAASKLEEGGYSLDTEVTIDLPNISLRGCLRQALGDMGLTYTVRAEGIVVTTPEDGCYGPYLKAYPVHDLMELEPAGDMGLITQLVMSEVVPDSWDDVGGPGSIDSLSRGWLLVAQTQDVHIEIEKFLSAVRHETRSPFWPAVELDTRRKAVARMEKALRKMDRLHADVLPLREFTVELQRHLEIPVVVHRKTLEEAAIDLDTPICCHLPNQPLWRWLRETLAMNELSFRIDDECLLITTPEDAASRLTRDVHNVQDLTTPGLGLVTKQTLTDLIVHAIDSDSWEERGGPGSLQWLGDCLIVSHDDFTRHEIQELLEYLRNHQSELPSLAAIKKLDRTGSEFLAIIEESETSADRWRSAWLRFAVGKPLPPPVSIGPFGCASPPLR